MSTRAIFFLALATTVAIARHVPGDLENAAALHQMAKCESNADCSDPFICAKRSALPFHLETIACQSEKCCADPENVREVETQTMLSIVKRCTADSECGELPFNFFNKFFPMKCVLLSGQTEKSCVPTLPFL
ncbi:hypothetical protein L596_017623 [Steinernema carpocapsae]|uniref:Domain of unknown function DB domain-containing protein n=1 Tax=Steinernema carpocapsae TaxID=34508 RepID=A0A4U5N276_STECR|nr:hypothetical protein L596_017623 [Steinernema carpocapsae]